MPGPYPRDSEVIWVFLEAHRQCCLQITTKQEPTVQYISDLENTGMRPRVEVVQEHRGTQRYKCGDTECRHQNVPLQTQGDSSLRQIHRGMWVPSE